MTFDGHPEDKMDREKQRVTFLASFCKWMDEQEVERIIKR